METTQQDRVALCILLWILFLGIQFEQIPI